MNKKGMILPLEFLITIVIAILLFSSAIGFAQSFFRLSSQGVQSYNELVKTINDVGSKQGKYSDTAVVRLDESTAIIGFSDKKDYVQAVRTDGYYIKFDKPASCENSNCVCLCRKADFTKGKELSCEQNKFFCLKINYELSERTQISTVEDAYFEGGFIVIRVNKKLLDAPTTAGMIRGNLLNSFGIPQNNPAVDLSSRTRTVYIQKLTGAEERLIVCETPIEAGACNYGKAK